MNIVIFGAGKIGREAIRYHKSIGDRVILVLDNNSSLWGTKIDGIEIASPNCLADKKLDIRIIIGTSYAKAVEIEKQLKSIGIQSIEYYNMNSSYEKERILSYCSKDEMEDVVLHHILKDEKDIFYIDVGSNDPVCNSVTKWLYDTKNAHGINIEPQKKLWEITQKERPRDINLCIGVGCEEGREVLNLQGGISTICKENVLVENIPQEIIQIRTLTSVCQEYAEGQRITFLKIDVEGYEKQVLLGMDFRAYRPEIIIIESTIPCSMIYTYEKWEYIITEAEYHYVYSKGVNRYYVANECAQLYDYKFKEMDKALDQYYISRVKLEATF